MLRRKRMTYPVVLVDWDGTPRETMCSPYAAVRYVKAYFGPKANYERIWHVETVLPDGTVLAFERGVPSAAVESWEWLW